jgi:hypothetical protein
MLLKIGGKELEIIRGKFVCFVRDNGETSYFSEWRALDRELQEKFEAIRAQLLEIMEQFVDSRHNALFEAASEEYKKDRPGCCVKKPEPDTSS